MVAPHLRYGEVRSLGVDPSRGVDATDRMGLLPRLKGTLTHDRWAMRHAIRNAHLLRDLAAAAEITGQEPRADAVAALLVDARRRCDAARDAGADEVPARQR